MILDTVAPGVINHCSSAFNIASAVATVASFLIPGEAALHVVAFAAHAFVAFKAAKVLMGAVAGAGKLAKIDKSFDGEAQILREMTKARDLPMASPGGWKAGNHALSPLKDGSTPSWNAQRSRIWKNQAAAPDRNWDSNQMSRMQQGLAPQRTVTATLNRDGTQFTKTESMELSHEPVAQRDQGTEVAMRWPTDHGRIDPYRNPNYTTQDFGTGLPF